MNSRLYWVVAGGLSFWLPTMVVPAVVHQDVNIWILNLLPIVGITLFGGATWVATKHPPRWGWVLAGIYILGPVSMLAPGVILQARSSPRTPAEIIFLVLICLLPPMTIWVSLLNGMLFSVLAVTIILPILASISADP